MNLAMMYSEYLEEDLRKVARDLWDRNAALNSALTIIP